jgi:hypothetical protein
MAINDGLRGLTPEMREAVIAGVIKIIFLFEADFPSGPVRVWTGLGTLQWDDKEWLGVGSLINVESISDDTDTSIRSMVTTLSGLDPTLLGNLETDDYHQREGSVWLGLINDAGIVPDPYLIFNGRLDSDEVIIAGAKGDSMVRMTVTDYMGDLLRVRAYRYTHEDQQALYPGEGDLGLEFVNELQEKKINWGIPGNATPRGSWNASGGRV